MSEIESPLQLQVLVSPSVDVAVGGTFSPTTATIITGPTEAVLVDTLYTPEDVERLGSAIEATGKRLTTIYITHAHFDHYVGLGPLLERFPQARGVALAPVAQLARENLEADIATTDVWLPGKVVAYSKLPDVLEGETITLDGHELHAIEVGQADIAHSTVLHVPVIDAVVAGDVVYNGVHQMLGLTGPDDWKRWIESVDKVEALKPKVVVAGHKRADRPDDDIPAILDGTREYIAAFLDEFADAEDAETLVARMSERFPDRINIATLQFSAAAVIEQRKQAEAAQPST
jgi:glyoxylase-like metal-dependent hydrolase (beta-lactamase superfamily II)